MKQLLELFRADASIRSVEDLQRHYCLTGYELLYLKNRFTWWGMASAIGAITLVGLAGLVVGYAFGGGTW